MIGFLALASPDPAGAGAAPRALCPATPARFELLSLPAPSLERSKRLWVYLPPGYDCTAPRRYPVFYFNDGQDLFDWNPFAADLGPVLAADIAWREAWYGSWQLDSQLERAVAEGRLPAMIIVGIASDDGLRSRDLAPVPWFGSDEGRGTQYGAFVARIVVREIDRRYRTIPIRRCRGIGGASLGGISALQIGLAYPARFGMVLSFSPVLGDPALAGFVAGAWRSANGVARSAYLVDFDDDPGGTSDRVWLATVTASTKGFRRRAMLVQTSGGRHAIGSWARRAIPGLEVLFAAQCSRIRLRG